MERSRKAKNQKKEIGSKKVSRKTKNNFVRVSKIIFRRKKQKTKNFKQTKKVLKECKRTLEQKIIKEEYYQNNFEET